MDEPHNRNAYLCKNKLEGNCNFTADMSWWNHEETQNKNVVKIASTFAMNPFPVPHKRENVLMSTKSA